MASKKSAAGEGSEGEASENGSMETAVRSRSGRGIEYSGWVYHLGVNSIGREYCHLRFLSLRGKYVAMFKRDPHDNPGIRPIRKGVISPTLMVEDLGCQKVNHGEFYVIRFYNRLDQTKKGDIACASPGEARKWLEAFDQAKQQAEYDLLRGNGRNRLNIDSELNLEGHRPRVRRYAQGLTKLIRIGKGPEMLLRQSSDLGSNVRRGTHLEGDMGDAFEANDWRCVRIVNGVRIFEDVSNLKGAKGLLLKSVGVMDAEADTVFEVVLGLDKHKRYEWDMLTCDLELVDSVDGHCDVVCGTYDPKFFTWWQSKRDFVFSRQWFRGQDGSYTILHFPAVSKNQPRRSGYKRTKINPFIWEIRRLNTSESTAKCLVTLMLEIHSSAWARWKRQHSSNFEKTVPYALLCQVAGLREYFGANPALRSDSSSTIVPSTISDISSAHAAFEDSEVKDEFYDALASEDSLEDEDSDDDVELPKLDGKVRLRNVSWAIASLALKRSTGHL